MSAALAEYEGLLRRHDALIHSPAWLAPGRAEAGRQREALVRDMDRVWSRLTGAERAHAEACAAGLYDARLALAGG